MHKFADSLFSILLAESVKARLFQSLCPELLVAWSCIDLEI